MDLDTMVLIAVLLIVNTVVCHFLITRDNRLNSNVHGNSDISFVVDKIEKADTQYEEGRMSIKLCKYTVSNCFFGKSKNRDFVYNTYVFYDKPNKYKLGDVLTLTNVKETCRKEDSD